MDPLLFQEKMAAIGAEPYRPTGCCGFAMPYRVYRRHDGWIKRCTGCGRAWWWQSGEPVATTASRSAAAE